MKKFLGFLVDLFVILLELAICAFIVFYLISHPIVERVTVNNVATTRSLDSSNLSHSSNVLPGSKRSITARPKGSAGYSSAIWIPEQLVPKQWGYDRVYSLYQFGASSRILHIPGSATAAISLIFRDIFLTRTQCYV